VQKSCRKISYPPMNFLSRKIENCDGQVGGSFRKFSYPNIQRAEAACVEAQHLDQGKHRHILRCFERPEAESWIHGTHVVETWTVRKAPGAQQRTPPIRPGAD
jgi:hypothetical protein